MAETVTRWIRRARQAPNLILFVHGFNGSGVNTWLDFPDLIQSDGDLQDFDCCFWGYDTSINVAHTFTKWFWSDDPNLDTVSRGIRTVLDNQAQPYRKIVIAAHSMGGLVTQLFLTSEIRRGARAHLDRITEVVLYGTPSNGLVKASLVSLLNTQAADMSWFGGFIRDLRYQWTRLIDDKRATDPQTFRLTLVAGMCDKFVPQTSSLDPFPFDEKEIVPGNHIEMVKPKSADDTSYAILKKRLLRGNPTEEEKKTILGRSKEVVDAINRIRSASELGDVDDLADQSSKMAAGALTMPLAERALGLALLDYEDYGKAVVHLKRYVEFRQPGSGEMPFRGDAQVLQQLALAQSGAGDIVGSVASIKALDEKLRSDPETLGILGGRFKRQWLKTGTNPMVARRALDTYREALQIAKTDDRVDQVVYNGVNVAYLEFALGEPDYKQTAEEIRIVAAKMTADYWSTATVAETLLLEGRHTEAETAYRDAARLEHAPRHWASTGQQALDILQRQGRPAEGEGIRKLFGSVRRDF